MEILSKYLPPKIAQDYSISENNLQEVEKKYKKESKNAFFETNREKLKDVSVVFLPHHGSSTENSQRWMGNFSNLKEKNLVKAYQ